MSREFKKEGKKFFVANRCTGGYEINEYNPSYDVFVFSGRKAWERVGSCMTIAEGREIAENYCENFALAI